MKSKKTSYAVWLAPLLLAPLLAGLSYGLMLLLITPPGWAVGVESAERAVQRETAVASPTQPAQPAPTATAAPVGFSRSNPHPVGSTVSLTHWNVAVVGEPIRGQEAWEMLREANMFNDPPAAGQEYLLVQMGIAHTRGTSEEETLGLHVTGSTNVIHFSFDNGQVPPEPILDNSLPGPAKSQGWEVYNLAEGEVNLVLIIDDLDNYEEPTQYLALTDAPPPAIPTAELTSIQRTNVGVTTQEPAGMGDIATSAEWQVQVLEVVRGESAWQALQETNQYNDPPPAGFEYVLVRARVRYLGLTDEAQSISRFSNFVALNSSEEAYEGPSLVVPAPELSGSLFPGGEITGWLALQVADNDAAPLLKFEPYSFGDSDAEVRYFWLGGFGR